MVLSRDAIGYDVAAGPLEYKYKIESSAVCYYENKAKAP